MKVSHAVMSALAAMSCGHAQARRYSEAFQEQFLACNQALLKQRSINCSLSGSTGAVAFLQVSA